MRVTKSEMDELEYAFGGPSKGLADVVRRLIQEVEVLKKMLRDKCLWDEAHYKKQMLHQMIHDHNSVGCVSESSHSYYPYTLKEPGFLRYRFAASDDEVAAFEREVDHASSLT